MTSLVVVLTFLPRLPHGRETQRHQSSIYGWTRVEVRGRNTRGLCLLFILLCVFPLASNVDLIREAENRSSNMLKKLWLKNDLPKGNEKSGYYVKPTCPSTTWDDSKLSNTTSTTASVPQQFTTVPLQDMTNRTLDRSSSMISVDENLFKKLSALFPSVQEDELRQLCKKSYNNELVVMSDLAARGYRPTYSPSSCGVRTGYAQHSPSPGNGGTYTTTTTTTTSAGSPAPINSAAAVAKQQPPNNVGMSDWSSTTAPPPPRWIRRTQSPGPVTRVTTHLTHKMTPPSSSSGSPATTTRFYYPGRFVQGVGFEPSSMGGAPQVTGKPFAPLQGRYALAGMISGGGSSPRTMHLVQAVPPRDPTYGAHYYHQQQQLQQQHQTPPPPPPPLAPIAPPPPASRIYAASAAPNMIPSWYGDDDRLTGSPLQPSPRFYSVVHDALVRNRVMMDRAASPPTAACRTFVHQGRAATPERVPTPPYIASHPVGGGSGGSFYATASRLYSQTSKSPLRTAAAVIGRAESPAPHYHVPPRSQVQPSPPPQPTTCPSYRTYSPVPSSSLERTSAADVGSFLVHRSSPGSHSPKIKLRYLRRIYPGVDETVLLDILANSDNNVQTAMTELNTMGYVKVDTPPARQASALHQQQQSSATNKSDDSSPKLLLHGERPVAPPRRLTKADKQKTRARLLEKVKEIPAAILTIALESVDFDEERAMILLNSMKTDDKIMGHDSLATSVENDTLGINGMVTSEALQNKLASLSKSPVIPVRRSLKDRGVQLMEHREMLSKSTWTQEDLAFRSRYKSEAKGFDLNLRKGPNKELVINENMLHSGPNPCNFKGRNLELLKANCPKTQDESPLKALLGSSQVTDIPVIKGPVHSTLPRGPQSSLIQGSTYKFP